MVSVDSTSAVVCILVAGHMDEQASGRRCHTLWKVAPSIEKLGFNFMASAAGGWGGVAEGAPELAGGGGSSANPRRSS